MLTRKPRISTAKQEKILECFAMDLTATITAKLVKVSRKTANRYFMHVREKLFQIFDKAPRFYGEVEVDQAFFGKGVKKKTSDDKFLANAGSSEYGDPTFFKRRRKVKKKKNKRPHVMVFGILRRKGDVYTHIIQKADRDTLLPIIHLIVDPKATIYSDSWPAFNELKIEGYKHGVINHSTGYINMKGTHTGGIDSFWSHAKFRLAKFKGINTRTFPLHLKECEWRWNTRAKKREGFAEIDPYKRRLAFLKKLLAL